MAKRAAFLTMVLCLVMALMAMVAFAADTVEPATGTCGEGLIWTVDAQGKLTISGTGAMETYAYGSAPWYAYRDVITSVVVEPPVTGISDGAFHGFSAVVDMTLPFVGGTVRTTEQIYQYPLGYVFGTDSYDGGVETLQRFYWTHLEELVSNTYYVPGSLRSVTVTGGNILAGAFYNCSGLTSVDLPEGIDCIRECAFTHCESLTSMEIPEGVGRIWSCAFSYCAALESISIPDSVTWIGSSALVGCASLREVVIPKNVTILEGGAFSGCSALEKVIFCGDVPETITIPFDGITIEAYYPSDNATWTSDALLDYGGTVTWVALTKPVLQLDHPSLSFEDEVRYNVYYSAEQLDGVVEMGLITFADKAVDGTIADAVSVMSGYVTDGSVYMVRTEGVSAPRMGDAVYFKVYAKLADGTYAYSPVGGYSAVAYAKQMLADESTSPQMQSLVVSMLNYGAEAQKFFGYDTGDLMDAFLTEAQKALVTGYDEAMMDPPTAADAGKAGIFVLDSFAFGQCYPTVSFDSAFALNYYFTANLSPDAGMTLYYWDAEDYDSATTLTVDNATGSVVMTDMGSGAYWGQVAGIAAKEMDRTVFAAGVYTSGGATYTTGIIPYSLGRYCEGIAANDASEQQALAQATAVYGYYAKAYFAG